MRGLPACFHLALVGLCFMLPGAARAGERLNLPQVSAQIMLDRSAETEIDAMLQAGLEQPLSPRLANFLLESLPENVRNGCRDLVSDFGTESNATAEWSVRLLHAESAGTERSAVLALRCTLHVPDAVFYDERPALLISSNQTVLKLLPLDADCTNCSDLFHLKFTQRFASQTGYLAELATEHSTDNPCCDGGDRTSGVKLFLIAVPGGEVALSFDKDTDDENHDDESGDTETVCTSEVAYQQNGDGLQAVTARSRCTENGKFKPPITTRRFVWDKGKKRFEERK